MAYSTSEEDTDLDNDEDSEPEIQTIYTSQPIIGPLTNPTPIAQVHILLDTYSRPILVIALFDMGAAATILHPKILPAECWLPHNQMFRAANGENWAALWETGIGECFFDTGRALFMISVYSSIFFI